MHQGDPGIILVTGIKFPNTDHSIIIPLDKKIVPKIGFESAGRSALLK